MGNWVQGSTLDLKQGYFVCWNNFKFTKNDNRSFTNLEELEKGGNIAGGVKKKTNLCNFYEFKTSKTPH